MKFKNKKGQVAFIAVIILIGVLAVVWYSATHPYPWTEKMGERQNAMLESYSAAEAARQFVKDAANLSAEQAFYDLAGNGLGSTCGAIDGFAIWKKSDGTVCISASDLMASFKEKFIINFENYQDIYVEQINQLELDKYELSIPPYDSEQNTLKITEPGSKTLIQGFPSISQRIGSDTNEEEEEITYEEYPEDAITIYSPEEAYNFVYSIDPHFKVEFPYTISAIIDKADTLSNSCDDNTFSGFGCSFISDDSWTKFTLTSTEDIYVIVGRAVRKQQVQIKFAIEKPSEESSEGGST